MQERRLVLGDGDEGDCLMALERPTGLTATTISPHKIDLHWKNEDRYHVIQVWRKIAAGAWVKIEELAGSEEYYQSSGLDPDTLHTYYVVGETIEPPETSPDSAEASDTTYIELEDPTDCVVTAFADFIEIIWTDNSDEDEFYIYRQVNGGGYPAQGSPTYVVSANMDYYRDTAITPGDTYEYKIAAKQDGPSYSGYSNTDSVVAPSAPSAPTLAAILGADTKDKSIRIRWTDVGNETGYRIEQEKTGELPFEADEADLIAVVGAGVTDFLATGLDVNTSYSFRVRAYNGVGNSSFSATRAATTDAAYVPTEYEKWIRDPHIEPVYLAEIYTKMDLTGFTLESGVTWKKTIGASDRGIDILEVFEDGNAYSEQTSIVTVEANAESFWFDYDNRILYIHTTGGANPNTFDLIEGAFWLYFSTHKDKEFTANGRVQHFLPLLTKEDIPDITQEIKPYFEGSFGLGSGSIAFKNAEIMGEHFFDKKFAAYTWINNKVILKAGKNTFTYAQFKEIFTGYIESKGCSDTKITFQLRDIRQDMEQKLVLNRYTEEDFVSPEDESVGEPIPVCFGYKGKVAPVCIDWAVEEGSSRKYNYHDGRSWATAVGEGVKVYKNTVELTEGYGEDYYVDYKRSIITFKRDSLDEEDIIEVSFMGKVNSANEPIKNHAEIFKYIMNTYRGLANSRLNLDSIYEAKYANTDELSVFLYNDTPYDEIIRNIEHSGRSFTFQDEFGKLGIRPQQTVVASNVKYIVSSHIFDHSQNKNRSSLFWKANVHYNENPQSQKWKIETAIKNEIYWKYDITKELDISTYFDENVSAESLAASILNLLNKEQVEDELPMLLFDVKAGDLIKFSRTRFYDSDGTASEITLRVIKISKSPASGKTSITAEVV